MTGRVKKKKVSRRKLVKKAKQRGRYKPKSSLDALNVDLTDCLFSDEDVGFAPYRFLLLYVSGVLYEINA